MNPKKIKAENFQDDRFYVDENDLTSSEMQKSMREEVKYLQAKFHIQKRKNLINRNHE